MERGAWRAIAMGLHHLELSLGTLSFLHVRFIPGHLIYVIAVAVLTVNRVISPFSPKRPFFNRKSVDCYNQLCGWPCGPPLLVTVSLERAGMEPHHPEIPVIFTSFLMLTPLIPSFCQMTSRW